MRFLIMLGHDVEIATRDLALNARAAKIGRLV